MDMDFFQQRLPQAFDNYLAGFADRIPSIMTGLVVLVLGFLFAKAVRWAVQRICERSVDPLAQRLGIDQSIARFGGLTASRMLATLSGWLVILLAVLGAADILGFHLVSQAVQKAIAYLPTLLTAVAIFLFGVWGADKVKALVSQLTNAIDLSAGRAVGRILSVVVMIFTTITALNVAGVDTSLITNNIQIVLAGLLLAFALAYGVAARAVLRNFLGSYYGNERFKPGMRLRVGEDEGVVEQIDSIRLTLRKEDRLVLIPTNRLVTERIEVLDEGGPTTEHAPGTPRQPEDHNGPFA